ncbi:hypothetical protein ACQKDB_14470 [Planococcus kocurii]|uniref:hypothetical protein n=1 Tax=Planococcus kocurii TaxID=1374 RepID=UPI00146FEA66|nr:hypothetical protein [Planococcus kocurii]
MLKDSLMPVAKGTFSEHSHSHFNSKKVLSTKRKKFKEATLLSGNPKNTRPVQDSEPAIQ